MISDPDIWRAAQLVIKRDGIDAPIVAAQRADEPSHCVESAVRGAAGDVRARPGVRRVFADMKDGSPRSKVA